MVKTVSTMRALGTTAPSFTLPEPLTGKEVSLSSVQGEHGTLVVFICNHCPFVVLLKDELQRLGTDLKALGIAMVAISSNDIQSYPQDGPDLMKEMAETQWTSFPYLFDETQEVAKAYHAACTPDIYLYDKDLKLAYRGQIDSARPGNGKPVNGESIRAAAQLLAEDKPFPEELMVPSIGCNIKWKSGNEPDYFG